MSKFPILFACAATILVLNGCALINQNQPEEPKHSISEASEVRLIRTDAQDSNSLRFDATPLPTSLASAARDLSSYDVIFVGERHGNHDCHTGQLALLESIDAASDRPIALSMEQFERSDQPAIDEYLSGNLEPAAFAKSTKVWKDYARDYQPMVDYCKEHGWAVIGANASNGPRLKVSAMRKQGMSMDLALAHLSKEERGGIARDINTFDSPYRRRFLALFGVPDLNNADPARLKHAKRTFSMQCVWDDTMAESMADYLKANPGHQILHTCGSFHSANFGGTVERLKLRMPELKIAVVTPIAPKDKRVFSEAELQSGHYLLMMDLPPRKGPAFKH